MMNNNQAKAFDFISPAQKQHDLRLKRVRAFRAKCLRKRYSNQLKRHKHEQLTHALNLSAIKTSMNIKPGYKANLSCLFFAKKIRDAQLAAIKDFNWQPKKLR